MRRWMRDTEKEEIKTNNAEKKKHSNEADETQDSRRTKQALTRIGGNDGQRVHGRGFPV